jgi:hypothetical protein
MATSRREYQAPFGHLLVLPEFEQRSVERETGVAPSSTTYSDVEFRYRLAGSPE